MDREQIQRILPHREPMLLVDEMHLDPDGIGHGTYRVPDDPFFTHGHFPGNPIVPGVILCEMMAQASIILMADKVPGRNTLYRGIDKVKFKGMVRPGDLCETVTRLIEWHDTPLGTVFSVDACLKVAGALKCRGQLEFILTPKG